MGVKMKKGLCKYFIFLSISASLGIFYYIICYYQMRIGDDVLFPFYMGFRHYLDEVLWVPEGKVETLKQAFGQYGQYYLTFSGRVTSLLQGYLFNKLGEKLISVLSAMIYVGTILLVGRIGLKSWKNVMKSPAVLLLSSLYMYQLTTTGTYISMWTFVCQYAIPTLLFLLYYFVVLNAYQEENLSFGKKALLFVFGFLCGLCHECLGAFVILLVSIKAVYESYIHKSMKIKRMGINFGLYLGYLVIFLAPGNYKRLLLDHDADRASLDVFGKIKVSIYEHLVATGVLSRQEVWMLLLFGIAIIWTYAKHRYSIFEFLKGNLELIAVIVLSIPVWAVFAPPVPQYGLQLWKACFVILMLKAIDVDLLKDGVWNIMGAAGLVAYIACNVGWLTDLAGTTIERRKQISEAIEDGRDIVYVERYPESTYGYLTMYNAANQKDAYDNEYALEYYGIRVLVKGEDHE